MNKLNLKKLSFALIIVLIAMTMLFTACTPPKSGDNSSDSDNGSSNSADDLATKKKLIGKWELDADDKYEFKDDGTYVRNYKEGSDTKEEKGKFSVSGNEITFEVEKKGEKYSQTMSFAFSDTELIIGVRGEVFFGGDTTTLKGKWETTMRYKSEYSENYSREVLDLKSDNTFTLKGGGPGDSISGKWAYANNKLTFSECKDSDGDDVDWFNGDRYVYFLGKAMVYGRASSLDEFKKEVVYKKK